MKIASLTYERLLAMRKPPAFCDACSDSDWLKKYVSEGPFFTRHRCPVAGHVRKDWHAALGLRGRQRRER
jgi:hypothetical protein